MIGPNTRPTRSVPRFWTTNRMTMTTSGTDSTAREKLAIEDLDAFDRGQHGDRGRDHAVAVEQRRAENADGYDVATHGVAVPKCP